MEGSALCLVAALLVCFPTFSHGQLYSMVVPSVLWVESEERIVVEAHGLNVATEVTISVHDFPQKRNTLYQVRATMNPANGMMVTPTIKVPAKVLKKDSKKNLYVFVHATCPQFTLEKVVLVSFQSGHIFTQTDKPIYTPGSSVRYRIFSIGHGMERLDKNVIVQFETPEGIIVSQNTFNPASNLTQSFNLPETVSLGTWNVVAKYQDSPQETFKTPFDVKEYVLPSFEVNIEAAEKFYHVDGNKNVNVAITARYLYGKRVEGIAFVLFGVKVDEEKKSIPDSLRRIPIQNGKGVAVLTKEMLQTRFRNLHELLGHSLYISVTVMTESGSDMVVAERGGIKIVTSPYQILFTKTPKFFKPGMPYELMVFVTNPDGSPAARVPLVSEPIRVEATTQDDGTVKLILNTPADTQELRITVKTNQAGLPNGHQANKTIVATAYQTQGGSGNYLHLAVSATELKAGNNLPISFNIRSNNANILNQFINYTYIILTKGRIFKVGRQPRSAGQNLVTMPLSITPNLIPSFRIVAYYQVNNGEIVADSVWVDVKDTCMGTLVVKGETEADSQIRQPGQAMKIKVEGDPNARIGLVAVDKAVYVLNKKNKISQSKIWDTVEKSDIGCTAGSGRNNVGVFEDAGLALETSNKLSTKQRSDLKCLQVAKKRRRRSLTFLESKTGKAAQYPDKKLKKCCEDGMFENPMGYSCEKRAEYIDDQKECKTVFLECCNFIKNIRDQNQREKELQLARSDNEEFIMDEDDIVSRTEFPESWLWETKVLTEPPNNKGISSKTVSFYLKDSITTWEVLAVSISETKGICVADPYEIIVMKKFFIDLRLPYSVVRNEQVEVRAILYNYGEENIKVRVELIHNPAFCSASTAKRRYRQDITIRSQSSTAVPFVLVPLELGLHDIEVKGAVWNMMMSDGVKKKLRVVPEGIRKSLVNVIELEPSKNGKDGVQELLVKARSLDDIVPGTETETKISVQGDPVANIIENSIDGSSLNHLIQIPYGCAEQNMMRMTPTVIATHYLDATNQWEKVGVNRRPEAMKLIQQGYAQELTYKKPDHSYASWIRGISSTWLTAYIVKVFALASTIVSTISDQIVCGSVKWLILERQRPDGIFHDEAPAISGSMVGGYRGAEPEVSLTAFVLVALLESRSLCKKHVNILDSSINKASNYLLKKYGKLQRPYTTALTAYALALAGELKDDRVLMAASTDGNSWEEYNAHTYNIESTSYALLSLLKMKKFERTGNIVKWLTKQRFYGGTYGQTQATIMVFQALAQYEIDIPSHKDLNLNVAIKLPERQDPIHYVIDYEGALLTKTAETKLNEDFTVRASGQGKATMTVVTLYNAQMKADAAQCKKFTLDVTVEPLELGKKELKGSLQIVKIKICTRYLGDVDATMSIIDVSMLTGFVPDVSDLKRLSEGVDRFIGKYEINKGYSEGGSLVIYLDKVSHLKDECVQFRADQFFEVGLVQPASVKVYSYYNLDEQCIKFYHLPKESGLLSKICHGDVCRCAEESCSLLNNVKEDISLNLRVQLACKPGIDYVYKAKLVRIEEENGYDNYFMQVLETIKEGSDPNPEVSPRKFVSQIKCRETLNLEENEDYLIWGISNDLWPANNDVFYLISKDTWIERWPGEDECQDEEWQDLCNDLDQFSNTLTFLGCQV
ncbi:A.superbus venom factor 1 [Anolis carolinensis]|uniref:A.superbus venom factor 1 n=1 Tax=Anolis carolinensis TaxID=28377 RepID=UPI0004627493|nr:PREDICTED: A.superbus venom factor 1 [Anolis carolinensis]|eukprot:XP_008101944.1 PREDICTED: A.superbus venom factor 1 [Anolis carolinensis]